jgi:thiamine pyrophosphate-dependent acetolactate synthase large subunit-like protein
MPIVTGGQAVVDALQAEGVEVVFGIPGEHTIPLYDGLFKSPTIRHILTRHEQGAGFMAEGYALASGKVGVCITTTGPGAFNALTALTEAYGDSAAVLLVTSEIDREFIGKARSITHESKDQLGVLERATGWAGQANSVGEIPAAIHEAFVRMRTGRPRSTAVQVPLDVLAEQGEATPRPAAQRERGVAAVGEVKCAADVLARAERPVIWAGGGVNISGANEILREIADLLSAPVVTTPDGKGAIPDDHPLALGNSSGEGPVMAMMRESDVALVAGSRFQQRLMGNWKYPLPAQIVQIDADPTEIGKNYPVAVGLLGDARAVLSQLASELRGRGLSPKRGAAERVANIRTAIASSYAAEFELEFGMTEAIRSRLDRDAMVFSDTALGVQWLRSLLPAYSPRSFFTPGGFSTLGFAVPAAIGAKAAFPKQQVIAACGDGSFMFTCPELGTAVQEGLDVTVLLFNNDGHELIRGHQDLHCEGRHIAVDILQPDFVRFAEAFGALGLRVDKLDQLGPALDRARGSGKPAVVEITLPLRRPRRSRST